MLVIFFAFCGGHGAINIFVFHFVIGWRKITDRYSKRHVLSTNTHSRLQYSSLGTALALRTYAAGNAVRVV